MLCELVIYTTIKTTKVSVTAEVGALSAPGVVWAWSAVSSGCGWLGVVVARKAGLNWKL